tara:strand:- start:26336 stop:27502 length:1167 start_codon:yes stop_codon:yes gene_type:complete
MPLKLLPGNIIRLLAVGGLLASTTLGFSQKNEVVQDGVSVLIRTSAKAKRSVAKIDPNDPLATEKRELVRWEQSLEVLAENLAQRQKTLAERERKLAAREKEAAQEEAQLEDEEMEVMAREQHVRARETIPKVTKWKGPPPPSVSANHTIVIDARNGRILQAKNAYSRTAVASTQKLMTALLVCEAGDLDKMVVIEPVDTQVEPSILGFRPGQSYSRADLVKWLLVRSGNDVAKALGRDNAGSVEAFAEKMNQRALELGMTDSNFKNPHGLTVSGQYSTARDMALVAWECYHHPFIRKCINTIRFTLPLEHGVVRTAYNTNKLLSSSTYRHPDANGMKTGYTVASKNCLIASGARGNRERIIVALGCSGSSVAARDCRSLLDWALSYD